MNIEQIHSYCRGGEATDDFILTVITTAGISTAPLFPPSSIMREISKHDVASYPTPWAGRVGSTGEFWFLLKLCQVKLLHCFWRREFSIYKCFRNSSAKQLSPKSNLALSRFSSIFVEFQSDASFDQCFRW